MPKTCEWSVVMRTILFLLLLTGSLSVVAQHGSPELANLRTVDGRTLSSRELPKLKLKFAKPFKYAGGHTFILYNVARAEQHFFVDADKNGKVSRFYWVQFESYLPDNTHKYDYDSPQKVNIGGLVFFADAYARKVDPKEGRPDSDGNRAREYLLSKGFRIASDEVMMQRLVNMVDPTNRTELMIIYLEVLTPTGMTAADLGPKGKDFEKWPEVSDRLLKRAKENVAIVK
jgi:hypothetical protein